MLISLIEVMQKTKKSVAKKFKITGSGKLLRRKMGKNHFMRRKSVKRRRALRQDQGVGASIEARLRQTISCQ